MKVIVLLRAVHEGPNSTRVLPVLSPCDRAALDTALDLGADNEVLALTIGPASDEVVLRLALKAGAQRGLRIYDPLLARANLATLGAFIATFLGREEYDLVLAGQHSLDWASGATGPTVAHFLQIPHVTSITAVRASSGELEVDQLREQGVLSLALPTPSLITIAAGPPRRRAAASDQGSSEDPATASNHPMEDALESHSPADFNLTLPQILEDPPFSLEQTTPLPAVEFLDASSLISELKRVGLLP